MRDGERIEAGRLTMEEARERGNLPGKKPSLADRTGAVMARQRYRVGQHHSGWVVRRSGSPRPTSIHRTRAEAETAARQGERNQQVDLWVGGPNGRVLARNRG